MIKELTEQSLFAFVKQAAVMKNDSNDYTTDEEQKKKDSPGRVIVDKIKDVGMGGLAVGAGAVAAVNHLGKPLPPQDMSQTNPKYVE